MRITKENLTRYDQHFKSWQRRRLGYGKALENWHQTEEAGAVACWPVGGSPLEGKVKFSFTETLPVSGDKSPSNPSEIMGVETVNIKRFSKNCCALVNPRNTHGAISCTVNQDGTLRVYGTIPSTLTEDFINIFYGGKPYVISYFKKGCTYTASFDSTDSRMLLQIIGHNSSGYVQLAPYMSSGSHATFTIPEDTDIAAWFRIQCGRKNNADTTYDGICKVQIELGSQATEMELPAVVDSFDIPLGNTYYGGEIDLTTGLMTVTHVMSEIDGSVVDGALTSLTNTFPIVVHIPESILPPRTGYIIPAGCTCDKFPLANNTNDVEHIMLGQYYAYRQFRLYLSYSRCGIAYGASQEERIAAAKTWLNNNPVKLVLNLREDYRHTVQLSPLALSALAQTSRHEPRLNTVYTDADSVQITYQKSPIRAATEQEMAILGLGGNV